MEKLLIENDRTVVKWAIHHGQMDRSSIGTANNTGEQQGDQVLSETSRNAQVVQILYYLIAMRHCLSDVKL